MASYTIDATGLVTYPGQINGRRIRRMVVDSACTHTQIHGKWIRPDDILPQTVTITGTHGTKLSYPTVTVTLQMDGRKIRQTVVVNSSIGFDAVLGLDLPFFWELTPIPAARHYALSAGGTHRPRRQCARPDTHAEADTDSGEDEHSEDADDNGQIAHFQPQPLDRDQDSDWSDEQSMEEDASDSDQPMEKDRPDFLLLDPKRASLDDLEGNPNDREMENPIFGRCKTLHSSLHG